MVNENPEQREWLLSDADYQKLKMVFVNEVFIFSGKNFIGHKRHQLNPWTQELAIQVRVICDTPDKLKEFYVRLLSDYLIDLIDCVEGESFRSYMKLYQYKGKLPVEDLLDFPYDELMLNRLRNSSRVLACLGFDRGNGPITKSPLNPPFDKIDIEDPDWIKYLEIAENFVHAMDQLVDVTLINDRSCYFDDPGLFRKIDRDGINDYLMYLQYKALPGVIKVMRAFVNWLQRNDVRNPVNIGELTALLPDLSNYRFYYSVRGIDDLPIGVSSDPDVELASGDQDSLLVAVFEVLKNSFRAGKFERGELNEYAERGESYADIRTGMFDVAGQQVVAIEVVDKGTHIDDRALYERIRKEGDLLGYEGRDVSFGEILDMISQRRLTIPLKGGKAEMHSGIGVHSARRIVLEHNGEMYYANLKDGGVGCMILIPVDGKDSGEKLSDLGIKGLELAKVSEGLTESAVSQNISGRLIDYIEFGRMIEKEIGEVVELRKDFGASVETIAA